MSSRYPIPALTTCASASSVPLDQPYRHRVEEEIRRSRFITSLGHAPDKETARFFIDAIRAEFPDARHHCWAYVAGPPGDTAHIGQSDDGEPHGTAGRPMLTRLLHGGVGEVVAVVTRYFGGIKLGTGGLVRAYQSGVSLALESLPTTEKIRPVSLEILVDYAHINTVYRLARTSEVRITEEDFGQDARFVFEMPDDQSEAFRRALEEATDGNVLFLGEP